MITYLKLLKAIGAQMPPAGAIMTAAEDDDNLGNASKPGPGKGGGGRGEGYVKSTRFATRTGMCGALTLPGLSFVPYKKGYGTFREIFTTENNLFFPFPS